MVAAPPSTYVDLPAIQEAQKQIQAQKIDQDATLPVTYNLYSFDINQSKSKDDNDSNLAGTLRLGTWAPNGVLRHKALYKAPKGTRKDLVTHEIPKPPEIDISDGITVTDIGNNKFRWVKTVTPTTQWTFNLITENYGLENPSLTGDYEIASEKFWWEGSYGSKSTETTKVTDVTSTTAPSDPKNLLDEHGNALGVDALAQLTPRQTSSDGKLLAGQDGAQARGDQIMVKILMHALDDETKKLLFPDSSKLDSLTPVEKTIYTSNKDFFERGAVHYVTDMLRENEHVPSSIKSKLKNKRYPAFLAALTAKVKPTTGDDPVTIYGMNRDDAADKALLEKLRPQYDDVITRCYEEGYKQQATAWLLYIREPVYWFETLSNYYRTEQFLAPWKLRSLNEDDKETLCSEIGHKLSLLKHAAMDNETFTKDAAKLNVDDTLNFLHGQHVCALSYLQVIDDQFVKNITDLINQILATPATKEVQDELNKREEYSQQEHKEMLGTGLSLITAVNNHNSRLAMESSEYWAQRTPPGSKPARLTIGQLIESFEEGVENARLAKWLESEEGKSLMKPDESSVWSRLWSKTKAKVSNAGGIGGVLGKLLKGIFHALALAGLSLLLHVQGSEMNPVEEGRAITALLSEVLHYAGNIGRKVLNYLWGRGKVFKRAMVWFNDTLKDGLQSLVKRVGNAFIGSIGKVIRTLGLIGAVFSCMLAYWEMREANTMSGDDGQKQKHFTRLMFSLAVLEGACLVGEIVAEITGRLAIAAVCGPFAMAFSILGVVAMVVYFIWFAPDPNADLQKYIDGTASKYGDKV